MKNRGLQFALREWRQHMTRPQTLAGLLAATGIIAIAGPFGSAEALLLVPRAFYWLIIVVASYTCGFFVTVLLEPKLSRLATWLRVAILGVTIGVGVTFIVLGLNVGFFGFFPELAVLPQFVVPIIVISLIITIAGEYMSPSPQTLTLVPLLERLPFDKRAALVALSVEDHYVRVQTTKGEELILMRLSDAIREVGQTNGAQVHRSHWVSFDNVTSARKEGDRAILTMSNGVEIPVSRANISKIKDVGLLPS